MLLPSTSSRAVEDLEGSLYTKLESTPLLAPAPVPAVARLLPSLTDVAFLMPISYIFLKVAGARTLLGDGDTGWHLRTGEWILNHHQVPHTDIFSFTRPGAPWFAWEWLWDVAFAWLFRSWGMAAVVLVSTLLICLTSVALFRLVRRKCENGLVAIAVTLLATGGCAIHWLARPHLLTLLFFTITLHITDRASQGRTKLLAWLVPLTLLWTNMHGGFFVVFLVLACYIGGNLLNGAIERDSVQRRRYLSGVIPWAITAAACLAVTFVNPYGWQLHRHILDYVADPYILNHIAEFQGMDFHSPVSVYFEPLMLAAVAAALWAAGRRRFSDVILSMGWLHLALIAQRNIPLFCIAGAPVVAEGATALIAAARHSSLTGQIGRAATWFRNVGASVEQTDRIPRLHLVSAAGIVLVGLLLFSPKPLNDNFVSTYDPKIFPAGALPVLASRETHRIFAQDQWGDYLIYRLYPATRVFIDGRSDFYGDDFNTKYLDLIDVQVGWDKTLDRYGIDTIVLSPGLALTSTLKISRDWRVVYDDHISVVFRRNNPPTSSFSSDGEGNIRDRAITKSTNRDRERLRKPGI